MGNQCTPRSCQRLDRNTSDIKKQAPNIFKGSYGQIRLAPQETESDRPKTQTFRKSFGCQKSSELSRSQQSAKTKTKEVAQAGDTNETETIKEKIIQNMETLPTLSDDRKLIKKQQVEQKMHSSQLSKRNIKLNVETPSQVRDSLLSAWNKSNFHQSQLMKTVKYDDIFRPAVDSHISTKK